MTAGYADRKAGSSGHNGDNPRTSLAGAGPSERPSGSMSATPSPTPAPATLAEAYDEIDSARRQFEAFAESSTAMGAHGAAAEWTTRAERMRVAERAVGAIARLPLDAQAKVKALIIQLTPKDPR